MDMARVERDKEKELIARAQAGDRAAFGALVREHGDEVYTLARRLVGDPHLAADIAQEALIRAWKALPNFRGDAALSTWLHRITVNACLDRARKAASRKTSPVDDTDRLEQLLEPHESAEAPAERQDLHRQLLAALAKLPIDQRAALVLVDMQGYPVAEAARVLDVPVGTVKSRCARGRARLLPMLTHLREGTGDRSGAGRGRNRTPGTSVPPESGRQAPESGPQEAGPQDPAAVKGGGGRA